MSRTNRGRGFWRQRFAFQQVLQRRSNPPENAQKAQLDAPRVTPEQTKQLFGLVDELIKFSSEETGLPIKATVKRQIISRETVESNLKEEVRRGR